MKKISILGSTGSVGRSTLSLVDLNPDRFRVVGLAARRNAGLLLEQARNYSPLAVALHDREKAAWLRQQLPGTPVLEGQEGVSRLAAESEADMVVAAITGAAGLVPTLSAILGGRDVALANKETLVMAGELVMREAREAQVRLLPVDSEHSAIHQCLHGEKRAQIKRILLTASGGPFFPKIPP
jgi:1-deoxy-D-xylulose-5-phosphate reductoisomerase